MLLFDTCVITDAMCGREIAAAVLTEVAEDAPHPPQQHLSFRTPAGAPPGGDRADAMAGVEHILCHIATLPFDDHAAEEAALIRRELELRGEMIDDMDTLIAGTAVAHGCEVITRNQCHFQQLRHLRVRSCWR